MQPSELVKISMILLIADHLARTAPPRHWLRDFLRSPAGVGFALCVVIVAQHDLGSALVVGSIILGMYISAGTSPKLLAQTIGPAFALVILSIISLPFRRQRFLAFLDPWEDPHGPGYQLVQALVAIGSGGVFGVGLGHSVEKIHYLPEAHTDMIFSIVAEELGLLGVAIVLFAFTSLAVVGGRIAVRAEDRFHSLLAVGLTILLCVQAVINLGGVVGLLPLTGVPLPLVSYGGTGLIVMLFCLGLLANVASAPATDSPAEPAR
jgi:cell division protein FtsW